MAYWYMSSYGVGPIVRLTSFEYSCCVVWADGTFVERRGALCPSVQLMNRERSAMNSFRLTALVNMSASCSESAEFPPRTLLSWTEPLLTASLTRWKHMLIA